MLPAGDQDEVLNFLVDPATHGLDEPIKRIDTHGAIVFLAGKDVYKVKRAIAFDYMDFSTLEKRKAACENEIRVNQPFAPALYDGTVPVTRTKKGLQLGGTGDIVEWTVHLRRFDENQTFDKLAESTGLDPCILDCLAGVIAEAHDRAEPCNDESAVQAFEGVLHSTAKELCAADIFPERQPRLLTDRLAEAFASCKPLLIKRSRSGKVRRCHGDLHLRNIVLIDNTPVLFDAIDFDEAIATVDILFDLAFLLMDLWHRHMFAEANRIFNRYLWLVPDSAVELEGLALLPLFLSLRAAVRAKVIATQAKLQPEVSELKDEARSYLDAAISFLNQTPACLIAVGGLSGSGKTALSVKLAPRFGRPPGAVHLRSDIERKRLFGVAAEQHLPASAYAADVTSRIYDQLADLAAIALKAKQAVIVDATFIQNAERANLATLAQNLEMAFYGFWLIAPLAVLVQRIASRKGDASDADIEVLNRQAAATHGARGWIELDAAQTLDDIEKDALAAVK